MFYGLNRFSEDLDFSLLEVEPDFSLEPYFQAIINEFSGVGMQVVIREKAKAIKSNIESAFLKTETVWKELILESVLPQEGINIAPGIKVKLEVDRRPPLGFETEEKLLLKPYSFYVKCLTLPSLFAGKMHALLFRKWQKRVKGRDWYDLEWYIKKGIPLDLHHFLLRAKDTGDWPGETINAEEVIDLLDAKINAVSFDSIKEDIARFTPDEAVLDIWSPAYFKDLLAHLKFS
ncbi:nucleotidyl transferase AbiEii/AbiGii toxin family protein [Niabella hibiscisoli]|uniref:nucleotidyl transferase AbiEii/AbiGii toxin family protein n=1 Tax=Niabella hibiscisoli TaxID=1825928 RepID=UPI001F0E863B|nr:nucleotidyl transferase AbiEii/AbiGii toxin family protein [Niabella hibiscisoli]MCH5719213.1 nucleotidyl transferase AbiEii/AbiGii toxin family protein [Niabella hibiscisoli]